MAEPRDEVHAGLRHRDRAVALQRELPLLLFVRDVAHDTEHAQPRFAIAALQPPDDLHVPELAVGAAHPAACREAAAVGRGALDDGAQAGAIVLVHMAAQLAA